MASSGNYPQRQMKKVGKKTKTGSQDITSSEMASSTPAMPSRRPFANMDNLDLTAIASRTSRLNETVVDDGLICNPLEEMGHTLGNLSISRKTKPGRRSTKENEIPGSDSDKYKSFSSACSSATVREATKPQETNNEETIALDDNDGFSGSTSIETFNDLVDTDENSVIQDVPHAVAATATNVKANFSGNVKDTITELVRIINDMPVPEDNNIVVDRPKHLRVDLFKHQQYGVRWLHWRENQYPGGGILADEMGLGKTSMILAIVSLAKSEPQKERSADNPWVAENSKKNLVPSQATLVVCPTSMLEQWKSEIVNKTKNMSVTTFQGPQRKASAAALAQFDFVITTYPTMSSEIPKDNESRSPLLQVHWERIVLDEGHIVRNSKTVAAHAVNAIEANHRWIVTGTPVHNSADDMYSFVKFLRMVPFDDSSVWKFWIGLRNEKRTSDQSARLHTVGKSLLLRRTKDEVNIGDPTKTIPPKVVVDKIVELSEAERLIYDHPAEYAREKVQNLMKQKEQRQSEMQRTADNYNYVAGAGRGPNKKSENNFTHLFALLCRARQASVLPYLIHTMLDDEDSENSSLDESALAFDLMSLRNPTFAKNYKSAKISQLLSDIDDLRRSAEEKNVEMDKVIVISQWVTLLDIICLHLTEAGYSVVTLTGQQSLPERAEAMEKINGKNIRPQIMCLSLAAGGVGLNLVGANHVFFMDLHWNPQLELQAQDRVHRYGQTRPVTVTRYIAAKTVDERVAILQKEKLDLAEGILSNAKQTGGGLSLTQMATLFVL